MRNRELIPADVLLLQTSDAAGGAYVMTANLDGEPNLKIKSVEVEEKKAAAAAMIPKLEEEKAAKPVDLHGILLWK